MDTAGDSNSSCDSAWGAACVYDSSAVTLAPTYDPKAYTPVSGGAFKGINPVSGSVKWLSAMAATASSNNSSTKKPTTNNHPYGTKSGFFVLGTAGVRFEKGLGVHPRGYTIYNISNVDADTFYAAVGITNSNGKDGKSKGVIYQVYGDYGDGEYVLLALSEVITKTMTGEFRVNIKGVKNLRLVVEANGAVDSSGCAWAAACLYKADPNAPFSTRLTQVATKYPVSPSGGYTAVDPVEGTYMHIPAGAQYISDLPEESVRSFVIPSNKEPNVPRYAKRDTGYSFKSMVLGKQRQPFTKGMSVVASTEDKDDTYILADISKTIGTRFYAAVGIIGSASTPTNTNYGKYGVVFYVYGSKDVTTSTNPASYKLLACSGDIYKQQTGEFDVDISGYKTLLLLVDTTKDLNYGCDSLWANACVYTPDGVLSPERGFFYDEDGYTSNVDGFKGITNAVDGSVCPLGETQLRKSSNVVTADYPMGEPSTVNHPYGQTEGVFVIGQDDTQFTTGLGMQPKDPAAPVRGSVESWTLYNIRGMNSDMFYAAVGLTDPEGKNGSAEGVIFRLFGDYDGLGSYELLCESEIISGKMTGEFHVDVSGVQELKLVAVTAGKSNASSACVWAEPSVYTAVKEQEPVQKPDDKADDDTNQSNEGLSGTQILIMVAVAVAAGGAGVAIVYLVPKKKKTV